MGHADEWCGLLDVVRSCRHVEWMNPVFAEVRRWHHGSRAQGAEDQRSGWTYHHCRHSGPRTCLLPATGAGGGGAARADAVRARQPGDGS